MEQDLFTVHRYTVRYTLNETIPLFPFGDIHRDSPNCHIPKWHEFLADASKNKKALFLGMGDYLDGFSESERSGMNAVRLHQSSKQNIEDFMREKLDDFCKEISFMGDRLLGLIEGNHFFEFGTGITSTQYMAEKLKCRYLGASSLIRISFLDYGNRRASVDIFAHHGKGASRLVGGSLNTVQQMAECANADIYCMGHDHKKSIAMSSRIELTHGGNSDHEIRLKEKKILYARTGSFLKNYEPNARSYQVKGLLNPSDLGYIKIDLTPIRKQKNSEDGPRMDQTTIKIHASI